MLAIGVAVAVMHPTAYLFLNKSNAPFQTTFEINVLYEHQRSCTSALHRIHCHLSALVRYSIFPFQLRLQLHIICFVLVFVHLLFCVQLEHESRWMGSKIVFWIRWAKLFESSMQYATACSSLNSVALSESRTLSLSLALPLFSLPMNTHKERLDMHMY